MLRRQLTYVRIAPNETLVQFLERVNMESGQERQTQMQLKTESDRIKMTTSETLEEPENPFPKWGQRQISDIASPDAPTHYNVKGGSQSYIPVRFDLVDGKAMFAMCAVLHEGAAKHGANNWRLIDIPDHLNHLIMHAYAYLSGDRSDEHLSHIMCRAMFAQGVELQDNG